MHLKLRRFPVPPCSTAAYLFFFHLSSGGPVCSAILAIATESEQRMEYCIFLTSTPIHQTQYTTWDSTQKWILDFIFNTKILFVLGHDIVYSGKTHRGKKLKNHISVSGLFSQPLDVTHNVCAEITLCGLHSTFQHLKHRYKTC